MTEAIEALMGGLRRDGTRASYRTHPRKLLGVFADVWRTLKLFRSGKE
ncbi:MAG: hypothetical protein ACJA2W_003840 [Planctomycetota bacterium]|jgi:hypothetical protein